ncbi:hypothetical protein EPYR_00464 [Erwinia pyrifoliae DSM 12163]|nr:hypothetical protein EPYR_00464 [Erwinia pyrifoliae DSM 12163]
MNIGRHYQGWNVIAACFYRALSPGFPCGQTE